jgi:hypothetical protein
LLIIVCINFEAELFLLCYSIIFRLVALSLTVTQLLAIQTQIMLNGMSIVRAEEYVNVDVLCVMCMCVIILYPHILSHNIHFFPWPNGYCVTAIHFKMALIYILGVSNEI